MVLPVSTPRSCPLTLVIFHRLHLAIVGEIARFLFASIGICLYWVEDKSETGPCSRSSILPGSHPRGVANMRVEANGELIPTGGGDPIPLIRDKLTLGRRETCDIPLRLPNVSGQHCEMY